MLLRVLHEASYLSTAAKGEGTQRALMEKYIDEYLVRTAETSCKGKHPWSTNGQCVQDFKPFLINTPTNDLTMTVVMGNLNLTDILPTWRHTEEYDLQVEDAREKLAASTNAVANPGCSPSPTNLAE